MNFLPINICHAIYDVMVKHTGAPEDDRAQFVFYYSNPDGYRPTEFRCCSRWGMAGKFWWNNNKFYVSARSLGECDHKFDYERERDECTAVDALLAPIYEEFVRLRTRRNILEAIPAALQHQGPLSEQIEIITAVANKIGLQDAADWIQQASGALRD
jgi:hypothetical protein